MTTFTKHSVGSRAVAFIAALFAVFVGGATAHAAPGDQIVLKNYYTEPSINGEMSAFLVTIDEGGQQFISYGTGFRRSFDDAGVNKFVTIEPDWKEVFFYDATDNDNLYLQYFENVFCGAGAPDRFKIMPSTPMKFMEGNFTLDGNGEFIFTPGGGAVTMNIYTSQGGDTGYYDLYTLNSVSITKPAETLLVGTQMFNDYIVMEINEATETYDNLGNLTQEDQATITMYLANGIGLVKKIESGTETHYLPDGSPVNESGTETFEILMHGVAGTPVFQEPGYAVVSGSVSDGVNTISFKDYGAQVSTFNMDGSGSVSPVSILGNYIILFPDSTLPNSFNARAIGYESYTYIPTATEQPPFDIVLSPDADCDATTGMNCDFCSGAGGDPGGGGNYTNPECNSGTYLNVIPWIDANGNDSRDAGEEVTSGYFIDTNLNSDTNWTWCGVDDNGYDAQAGAYLINLPDDGSLASVSYEVGIWPMMAGDPTGGGMATTTDPQYGGFFVAVPDLAQQTTDNYTGETTDWSQLTLVPVSGSDVTLEVQLKTMDMGGGGTVGSGVHMTGTVFVDTDNDDTIDSGEAVKGGLWVDVWDEASGMWGGAEVSASDGSYDIDLPSATGDYEVNVWPTDQSSAYVGGTFVRYSSDDLTDSSYDGSATGNWDNKDLIPVDSSDVAVNIEVKKGVTISGVLQRSDGSGIAGVWINAWSETTTKGGGGQTDANGNFSFPVEEGVGYELNIWIDPMQTANADLMGGFFKDEDGVAPFVGGVTGDWMNRTLLDVPAAGLSGVEITLASGTRIFGKVITADGAPVPWLWVDANSEFLQGAWSGASTDQNGNFSMVVAPGPGYRISCWPGEGNYVGGNWQEGVDNANTNSGLDGKLTPNWDEATLIDVSDGQDENINIILGQGNAITGRVVDGFGNPVKWIWVEANSESTWSWFGGSTDQNGNFKIAVSPAADYRVQIWGDGKYMPQFYNNASNWDDATLVDTTTGSVDGIDFYLSSGKSISGTVSGLAQGDRLWINAYSESTWAGNGTEVIGDGSGTDNFTINGLATAADFRIDVWGEGYQNGFVKQDGNIGSWDQAAKFTSGATGVGISLSSGKKISGSVSGLSAGQTAWVDAWSESAGSWGGAEVVASSSNPVAYTINGLGGATDYRVSIWSDSGYVGGYYGDGGAPKSWENATLVDVSVADAAGVDFVLSAGKEISGTITGLGEGKIAWIDAWSEETGSWGGKEIRGTGSDKTYAIKGLAAAADFRVSIHADGYKEGFYGGTPGGDAAAPVSWDLATLIDTDDSDGNTNNTGVTFLLATGKSISGNVSGLQDGERAWIDAWSESTQSWGGTEVIGTGSDVAYTIKGLDSASDFTVNFWPEDYMPAKKSNINSSTNPNNVNFVASAGKTISGTITTAANAWVWVDAWSETAGNGGWADVQADGSGNAAYTIKGLGSQSDYVVSAWSDNQQLFYDGQTSWNNANPVSTLGGDVADIDFDFVAAGNNLYDLSGQVGGLSSDATTQIWIDVWDETTWAWGGANRRGNGAFTVKSLPAGNYKISVSANGYMGGFYDADDTSDYLSVNPNNADAVAVNAAVALPNTMLLGTGYTISGTVKKADGSAAGNIGVEAQAQSDGTFFGAMTNSAGKYEIKGLAPGLYDLTIWSTKGQLTDTADLSSGNDTVDFQFGGTGTGSILVTVTVSTQAKENAFVMVTKNGAFVNGDVTDASGSVAFEGLTDGASYTVQVDYDMDGNFDTPDPPSAIQVNGENTAAPFDF